MPLLAIGAIVVLVLSGSTWWLLARKRQKPDSDNLFAQREAVAHALDLSLDDLRAEMDARKAIIAAYARMELALGKADLPRRPSETPVEYLQRAFTRLVASAPAAERLTELFEFAKFSDHAPLADMKRQAIDALVAVRDELRGAPPVATDELTVGAPG